MTALFVCFDNALLVARSGQRWHVEEHLEGTWLSCAAADPHHPGRVYCGTVRKGLWRSDDAGRSWEPVPTEVGSSHITALAVNPLASRAGHGLLYAGTEPSRLFRSPDGGGTWEELTGLTALPSAASWSFPPRPHTHHVRWIEPDPVTAGRLFVAIEAGALVRTLDGGATWLDRVRGGPFDTHTMATQPLAPGRLYSAAGDGYYESHDAGETWQRITAGLRRDYVVGVGVDSGDPSTVLISASSGPWTAYDPESAEAHVYRKDSHERWQPVTEGLPDPAGTTVSHFVASRKPGVIYAANNRGVFRSDDAGRRWERLDIPWAERYETHGVLALLMVDAN